jgi:hypothetical protein
MVSNIFGEQHGADETTLEESLSHFGVNNRHGYWDLPKPRPLVWSITHCDSEGSKSVISERSFTTTVWGAALVGTCCHFKRGVGRSMIQYYMLIGECCRYSLSSGKKTNT